MDNRPPAMGKLLLFAGGVTLAVTLLRLYGELNHWDPRYFGNDGRGGGAIVGISWLIGVFGFWFGARLARGGAAPARRGRTLLLHVIAIALVVGAILFNSKVMQPDAATFDGLRSRVVFMAIASGVATLIAIAAWPRLGFINLAYGLLARVPVVVVTYIACDRQWGTHYEVLGQPNLAVEPAAKLFWLSFVQLTLWPAATVLLGGLAGSLAALLFRGKRA
jgi:hypothetical protein